MGTTKQITSRRVLRAVQVERDRAISALLRARRRHHGVTAARARLDQAVGALARIQCGTTTDADAQYLIDLVNPRVADPIGYLRERLGLAA